MIIFEKTYKERQCNCCFGKSDVIEVIFRSDYANQGTAIALCKDCRKNLCKMIDALDYRPNCGAKMMVEDGEKNGI